MRIGAHHNRVPGTTDKCRTRRRSVSHASVRAPAFEHALPRLRSYKPRRGSFQRLNRTYASRGVMPDYHYRRPYATPELPVETFQEQAEGRMQTNKAANSLIQVRCESSLRRLNGLIERNAGHRPDGHPIVCDQGTRHFRWIIKREGCPRDRLLNLVRNHASIN
jgi:hypothetical protein